MTRVRSRIARANFRRRSKCLRFCRALAFPESCRLRGVFLADKTYTVRDRAESAPWSTPLCRQREDVPLIRGNEAGKRSLIDLLHRPLAAAFDDLEPSIQHRRKTRPRRAEPDVDAARPPFPGAFANLVGRKKPGRLGARQFRLIRRGAPMGEPDPTGIFYLLAKVPVKFCAQLAVAGHVDERDGLVGRQRSNAVIGPDVVVAAGRSYKSGIARRSQ